MQHNELEACRERLEAFLAEMLFPSLDRLQQRKWGSVYVRGLLLDGERKSAGAMAVRLPDGNEQALQQFVTDSTWDFRSVRQRLAQKLEGRLANEGAFVIDDTGFPKKGTHSVGVARQYSGTLGKVGNCQIGVSIHLATQAGSFPLDFELYLPEEWTQDPVRCDKARVPQDRRTYRTKWQLALELLDRVRGWRLVDRPVVADAGYGNVTEFREALRARGLSYAVGIGPNLGVWVGTVPAQKVERTRRRGRPPTRYDYGECKPQSAMDVARGLPAEAWREVTWDEGSKGPLRSRFAALRVHVAHGYHTGEAPRPEEWLLVEWPQSEPQPTDFWLLSVSADTPLADLVRLAKMRWHVEQDYQQLKDELGLDHFEGRKWIGWHRHVTLCMLAYGFLLLERLQGQKRGSS